MIDLSHQPAKTRGVWERLLVLSEAMPSGWALIGAQMVIIHGLANGRQLPRATTDADVLVDVRLVRQGIEAMVAVLNWAPFLSRHARSRLTTFPNHS